ncbi:SCO7613 C-terminal domain-containing membrane protein [Streptomyces sp. NPDC087538]|uniref:SCO7613 C-terminal domain-containing membrane protein n=1 Tax=Streptomyces sp. NPDC087538 TaxID=3365797 RepID=UPI0038226458
MEHVPPPAEELALLDRELARLDARRSQLLVRRAWLLSVLTPPAGPPGAPPVPQLAAPFGPPATARPAAPFAAPFGPPAPQAGPRSAQNVLLTLGGLLLTIAAIAFTLVSWGQMGIAGRSAVLTVVTLAALAAPAVLLRRGLSATAESLGALASVLMILDAYALHRVAVPEAGGPGYAAAASAVLAVLWGGYGLLLGRLRLPLPLAVVSAQLPLLLWAWSAGAGASVFGWALLLTAALDCAIALWGPGVAVRVTACVGCWTTGLLGLLVALGQSVSADAASAAVAPAALLLAGAALALFGAWRAPGVFRLDRAGSGTGAREPGVIQTRGPGGLAVAGGVVAGLSGVAAVGGVLRAGVDWDWSVPVYLLCGVVLLTAVRAPLPRPVGQGLVWASSAVTAAAVMAAAPPVGMSLLGTASQLARVWTGAPDGGVRGALGTEGLAWSQSAAAPVVLLVVAGLFGLAHRSWPRLVRVAGPVVSPGPAWRSAAGAAATALCWAGLTALPAVLGLSYAAAVSVQSVLVAAVFAVAVRALRRGTGAVGTTALVCGLVGAVSAGLLSLAAQAATYAVFAVLLLVLGAAAVLLDGAAMPERELPDARAARAAGALRIAQAVPACGAVLCAMVLARAAGASLELAGYRAAPLMLAVPVVTALLGARLRNRPPALPVELTGALSAVVAVIMAVPDGPFLALVLALSGVLAAGTAVRAERRQVAGYLAVALCVLATWVRLTASGVSAPEAYTLPVTVPALAVGVLRRRRDPEASSWTAYGAGLSATLVPSLFAAWVDPHWLRPLLLGVAALVITLAGARLRLQALLLVGGAVLALDTVHELAPYVVQVVGALPRWLPPALAGLLLLVVGATYEQRLRDARRLKETVGRMR